MALLDGSARLPARPALIVVDVDGTLLTSTHEVSSATAREVRRVAATWITRSNDDDGGGVGVAGARPLTVRRVARSGS